VELPEDTPGYDLTIAENAYFSNGQKVTAEDVAFSLEIHADSPFKSGKLSMISSVEIRDEHTIRVHFDEYVNYFLPYLEEVYVVPKAYYEEVGSDGFSQAPIGSGAYTVESINPSSGNITLVRSEDYWGTPAKLEKISFRIIKEVASNIIALEAGDVDLIGLSSADYPTVAANKNIAIAEVQSNIMSYLCFNTEVGPSANKLFRQAVAYCLDYESINAAVTGGHGSYVITDFWLEKWGPKPDLGYEYKYDVAKAKELLAQSGITTPLDLGTVQCSASATIAMTVVQQNLAAIGIDLKIEQAESSAFIMAFIRGDYHVNAMLGNGLDEDAPSALLLNFGAESIDGMNLSRYNSPEFDRLLKRAMSTRDRDEKYQLVADAYRIFMDELPAIRVYQNKTMFAANKDLKYAFVNPYHLNLFEVSWK